MEKKRQADIPQCVKTDESKLRQVLMNLLSNAMKFTLVGSVSVRVRNEDAETGRHWENRQLLVKMLEPLGFEIEQAINRVEIKWFLRLTSLLYFHAC